MMAASGTSGAGRHASTLCPSQRLDTTTAAHAKAYTIGGADRVVERMPRWPRSGSRGLTSALRAAQRLDVAWLASGQAK
jgi:hypothetical protein